MSIFCLRKIFIVKLLVIPMKEAGINSEFEAVEGRILFGIAEIYENILKYLLRRRRWKVRNEKS